MFLVKQSVKVKSGGFKDQVGTVAKIQLDVFGEPVYFVNIAGRHEPIEFYGDYLSLVTGRGGARPNAGRPRDPDKPRKATKVVRLSKEVAAKLDYLLELEALVAQYKQDAIQGSQTSPRWQKLRDFLEEVDTLKLVSTFKLEV